MQQSSVKMDQQKKEISCCLNLIGNPFLKKNKYLIHESQQMANVSYNHVHSKNHFNHFDNQQNFKKLNQSTKSLKIKFQIKKQVKFGQALFVVGNIPQLGQWDNQHALRLQWNQGYHQDDDVKIKIKIKIDKKLNRFVQNQKVSYKHKEGQTTTNRQLKKILIEYRYFVSDYQKTSKNRIYKQKEYGWVSRKIQIPYQQNKKKGQNQKQHKNKKYWQNKQNKHKIVLNQKNSIRQYYDIIDEWNITKIKIRIAVQKLQKPIKDCSNNSNKTFNISYYLAGNLQCLGGYSNLTELIKQQNIQQKNKPNFNNKLLSQSQNHQSLKSKQYFQYDFKVSRQVQKLNYMIFKKIIKFEQQTNKTSKIIQKEKIPVNYVQLHLHKHQKKQNRSLALRSSTCRSSSVNKSFCVNHDSKNKSKKRQWSLCDNESSYSLSTDQQSDKLFSNVDIKLEQSQSQSFLSYRNFLQPKTYQQCQEPQRSGQQTQISVQNFSYQNGVTIINHNAEFQVFKVYNLRQQNNNLHCDNQQKEKQYIKQYPKLQPLDYHFNIIEQKLGCLLSKVNNQQKQNVNRKYYQLPQYIKSIKANINFTEKGKQNNQNIKNAKVQLFQGKNKYFRKINKKTTENNQLKFDVEEEEKPIFQMNFLEIQCLQHAICVKQLMINQVFIVDSQKNNIIKPILHKFGIQFPHATVYPANKFNKHKNVVDIQKEVILNFYNLVKWIYTLSIKHRTNKKVKIGIVSSFKSQVGIYLYGLFFLFFCQQNNDSQKDKIKNICHLLAKQRMSIIN